MVVEVLLTNPHLELNIPETYNWETLYWACGAGLSNIVRLLLTNKRGDCNNIAIDLALLEVEVLEVLNGRAETGPILLELNGIDVIKAGHCIRGLGGNFGGTILFRLANVLF